MSRLPDEDANEEDLDLRNPDVVTKYKSAADICNRVLAKLITEIVPGVKIVDVCRSGDNQIEGALLPLFSKAKLPKGIAFPTCLSVNNCIAHFSPLSIDTTTINAGDLVKIDLGCHIDGFIAVVAHTIVVPSAPGVPVTGRAADVIAAAYQAADVALHLLRSGQSNTAVPQAVQKAAASFQCTPLEGSASYQLKRFIIDGEKVIMNKVTPDTRVETCTFEDFEVYALDVAVSTGEGKGRELESRTTVYKRVIDQTYLLKLKSARQLFNEINSRFPTMPFSLRAFDSEARARLGVTELVSHNLVVPYPVMYEKTGELVAQFKFTVLLTSSGTVRITGLTQPEVKSQYSITDPELKAILNSSLKKPTGKKPVKKSAKKGKKKTGVKLSAGKAAAAADEGDEEEEIEEVDGPEEGAPAESSTA